MFFELNIISHIYNKCIIALAFAFVLVLASVLNSDLK